MNQSIPLAHPFRLLLLGKSGSGKTNLLINLLTNDNYYAGYFDRVHYCVPTLYDDPHWRMVKVGKDAITTTEYSDEWMEAVLEQIETETDEEGELLRHLVVMDDVGSEQLRHFNMANVLDKLYQNCRWKGRGVSFIISCQMYQSISTCFRHNADGVVAFGNVGKKVIDHLAEEFSDHDPKEFKSIFKYAVKEDYSFLFIKRNGPKLTYYKKFNTVLHTNE